VKIGEMYFQKSFQMTGQNHDQQVREIDVSSSLSLDQSEHDRFGVLGFETARAKSLLDHWVGILIVEKEEATWHVVQLDCGHKVTGIFCCLSVSKLLNINERW
jgi:hypothetical protein